MLRTYLGTWLDRAEKWLKTDIRYLIQGGFWLSFGQIISSASSFVLAISFANLLSPETYGFYRYVVSWTSTLAVTSLIGINTALIQAVARKYEASFWELFWTKLRWSLLGTLVSLSGAIYYWIAGNHLLAGSFVLVALGLPLLKSSGLYLSLLYGRKEFQLSATATSVVRLISTAVMLLSLFLTDNLLWLIAAFIIPEMVSQILVTFFVLRRRPLNSSRDPQTRSYGFHLSLMEFLKVISSQADKLLVFHYLGATELAIYSFATAVPDQLKSFLQNLTSLALPKMSAAKAQDLRRQLPRKILWLELAVCGLVVAYLPLAPWFYRTFLPQYLSSINFSRVFALSLLFLPRTFLSTALVSQGKHRELYAIRILSPLARLAILFAGLYWWGLWGLIIGKLFSEGGQALIYQSFFKKAFSSPSSSSRANKLD